MLSPLDDLPIHQVAETMATVGTTDRNFYDRYYFNMHSCSDELFVIMGMGQYPNLGVTDAFVTAVRGDTQRVVRASRELGLDRLDTAVGPMRVEVEEGLKKVRFVCEPNEHGIACDLRWEGVVPAHEEPRHLNQAPHGHVTINTVRFAQTGRWTGSLTIDGEDFEVTPDRWWGNRDRSWGTRSVGEPVPPGIGAAAPRGFFWNYAVPQFEDGTTLMYMVQESPDGDRIMERAVRLLPDGTSEDLGRPEHELEFGPGRNWTAATIRFAGGFEFRAESLRPLHISRGTGYGFDDDWRHGMYQGPELVVQGRTFDVGDPVEVQPLPGAIVDHVARFETGDGHVGHGLFEIMTIGPHHAYFDGWD